MGWGNQGIPHVLRNLSYLLFPSQPTSSTSTSPPEALTSGERSELSLTCTTTFLGTYNVNTPTASSSSCRDRRYLELLLQAAAVEGCRIPLDHWRRDAPRCGGMHSYRPRPVSACPGLSRSVPVLVPAPLSFIIFIKNFIWEPLLLPVQEL